MSCNCYAGWSTPIEAMSGPKEKLLYVPAVSTNPNQPDYLATIDVDPSSPSYSQVIHRLPMPVNGDELHHSGWNACSGHYGDGTKARKYLILPALKTGNIYFIDVATNEREPRLHHKIDGQDVKEKFGLTYPHTVHCAPTHIMFSYMGGKDGEKGEGGFLLVDHESLEPVGRWEKQPTRFGYDFWYQPRHNVMISTGWGDPGAFKGGFNPAHLGEGRYSDEIVFWDFKEGVQQQTIHLGPTGLIPLETRFLHDPAANQGYLAAALSSNVIRFYNDNGTWKSEVVVDIPSKKVDGWALPEMPSLITDFVISLDDKFIYLSNWLHGDVRQYDISDRSNPKLVGQVFIGGSLKRGGPVKLVDEDESNQPEAVFIKGIEIQGGAQMIQLSLDGKRLYVTTSLFQPWDNQFYPDMNKKGAQLLQVDVNTETGGLSINPNFIVDFGQEPNGPALCHEMRYPGGDCTSDIFK